MTFYSEALTTNTLWQPTDHLVDSETNVTSIAYFTLSEASTTAIKNRIGESDTSQEKKDYYNKMTAMLPMWKYIITGFAEGHSEMFTMEKGLSDSFTVMSLGTNTIQIMLSGILHMEYVGYDYRLDFLYIYDNFFRGYKLEDNALELQIIIENTIFSFKPSLVHYFQDTASPDLVKLQMNGTAYNYQVIADRKNTYTGL